MSELSNALRQRLASSEEPRVHPDADTLTAYVEQLLPAPERSQVLQHLGVCRQCREVMALSLSPQPVTQDREHTAVAALPGRLGWRAWIPWRPVLGLAASLAGLAIVATVIIELPRASLRQEARQPAPVSSASGNAPTPAPAAPESTAAQPAAAAADRESLPVATSRAGSAAAKPQNVPPVLIAETAALKSAPKTADPSAGGPYVNVQMFAYAYDAGYTVTAPADLPSAPAPRVLVDRSQNAVTLSSNDQLTAADAPHQTQSGKPLRIMTPPANAAHFGLSMAKTVGRDAKQLFRRPVPPMSANLFASSAMGGAGQFNPAKELGPSPEVTATAPLVDKDAAELDRSRAFTARALAGGAGAKVEGAAVEDRARRAAGAPAAWKVGDNKLLKMGDSGWTEGYPASEGIEFSVVSSRGLDIWAGGSHAALVHSRDGGATWERLTLGASATGTITSIEAGGSKILVRSSSGQSWSSADGGKTWALQD